MFADPQVITIAAIASNYARIKSGDMASTYATADGKMVLEISNQITKGNRERHLVKLTIVKDVVDPYSVPPGVTKPVQLVMYTVIDNPKVGFTDTEIVDIFNGFRVWTATGNITRVLGNES